MSKTMLVEFRGKGFWAYDVVAAVLLKYMVDAAPQTVDLSTSPWLQEMVSQWQLDAVVTECGFSLNDDWTGGQILIVQDLIIRACAELAQRDDLTGEEIESWQFESDLRICSRGHDLIPTTSVIRLGKAVIALLQNRLPEPPKGTWWFYGLEETTEKIQMSF